MRINLQSEYLEKTFSQFNQDLQKMQVRYNQLINDKVNDLEAKLQGCSTEKIPWQK